MIYPTFHYVEIEAKINPKLLHDFRLFHTAYWSIACQIKLYFWRITYHS
jgi:hypothetical protein